MSKRHDKHGVAALLAMLYLVLFSVMAVGFYTAVTTAMQVSHNDAGSLRCRLAAESGMELIRYQLASVRIPHGTNPDELLEVVYENLCDQMEKTGNLGAYNIGFDGDVISIPAGSDEWISVDGENMNFRALIEADASNLRVRTKGRSGNSVLNRTIKLDYSKVETPSSIFDYGVASRSVIVMDSNANISGVGDLARGSILSTNMTDPEPVQLLGNSVVSGDVSVLNGEADVLVNAGASIAGSTDPGVYGSHIHKGVTEPEFPTIDTDPFKPYAGNPAYGGTVISVPNKKYDSGTMKNILIKANTNPTFEGNMEVQGVIYIETPNKVYFDSNAVIRGVIVVQNDPTGDVNTNEIELESNVKLHGVDTLPATSDFPESLRAMTGSLILAPKFSLVLDSNFGSAGGSIVAGRIDLDSNVKGTIYGSVINLEDTLVEMDSNASIQIAEPLTANPAGMRFSGRYYPVSSSYEEVIE